jgi:hypothetical protein
MVDVYNYISKYNLPVQVCANLTQSFMSTGADGVVPAPSGNKIGGHSMVLKGIINHNGKLKYMVLNSWGSNWGLAGHCVLDPDFYALEMWGGIPEETTSLTDRPRQIMLRIGSTTMLTDAGTVIMPQAPCYINGKTMVPVREPFEKIGYEVKWYKMAEGGDIITMMDGGEQDKLEI